MCFLFNLKKKIKIKMFFLPRSLHREDARIGNFNFYHRWDTLFYVKNISFQDIIILTPLKRQSKLTENLFIGLLCGSVYNTRRVTLGSVRTSMEF